MSSTSKSTSRRTAAVDRDPELVLRGAGVTCRVQRCSFQPLTAQLVLYHQYRLPSLADLQHWTEQLRDLGYTRARTTALAAGAGLRAQSAGFRSIQELVLLEHTDPGGTVTTSRSRLTATHRLLPSHHAAAGAVDLASFGGRWALEAHAIADVCAATPHHRARGASKPLAAYAISGRDSKQGFLQRLAVSPSQQRRGLGRALVLDSLQWFARWRVQRVLVNTPADNEPALALYQQLGFRRLAEGLRVYEKELT